MIAGSRISPRFLFCHDDNALIRAKTIHLDKHLVQCLLTLVVSAAHSCATASGYCINLIDKYDTRRIFSWHPQTNLSLVRLRLRRTSPRNQILKNGEKRGTPASPATALARRVLPVPGGPTRRTPFGILAPSLVYFPGSRRKSTISAISSFSSFKPATSENLIWFSSCVVIFARFLPKFIIFATAGRLLRCCSSLQKMNAIPAIKRYGQCR